MKGIDWGKIKTFPVTPRRQVKWFDVRQLLITAWQALAATVVGPMTGRRELMSALDREEKVEDQYAQEDEIWIDYVADAGDGWDSTLSIAWLVGRDSLALRKDGTPTPQPIPAGQDEADPLIDNAFLLRHGKVLIFGGDQVYPTASAKGYQQRLVDPYTCARYFQKPPRDVFALPGNHDWYDGLTSFIRLFCQAQENRRWLGAWGTRQRRSYFALKLPHGWWLWGVDMALEDDLDPPQYEYFRRRSKELADGDQVILCVPTPIWLKQETSAAIHAEMEHRMATKLQIITELASGQKKESVQGQSQDRARAPVYLTGDLHHYAHYFSSEGEGAHFVVCGGGGAYGLGTLELRRTVCVATAKESFVAAECQTLFPDRQTSQQLRRGAWKFPLHNTSFTVLLSCIQIINLWLVDVALAKCGGKWWERMGDEDFAGRLQGAMQYAPGSTLWLLLILVGFTVYALSGRAPGGPKGVAGVAGFAHGLTQVLGALVLVWLAIKLVALLELESGGLFFGVTLLIYLPLLFFFCGTLFGLYLVASHKFLHLHNEDVFSSQSIEDYKSFLRMKVTAEGLTIYPVGLKKIARKWRPAPDVQVKKESAQVQSVTVREKFNRVFDPAEELAPHLIEAPIFIPGRKKS
jgi:hypothetical protein